MKQQHAVFHYPSHISNFAFSNQVYSMNELHVLVCNLSIGVE